MSLILSCSIIYFKWYFSPPKMHPSSHHLSGGHSPDRSERQYELRLLAQSVWRCCAPRKWCQGIIKVWCSSSLFNYYYFEWFNIWIFAKFSAYGFKLSLDKSRFLPIVLEHIAKVCISVTSVKRWRIPTAFWPKSSTMFFKLGGRS